MNETLQSLYDEYIALPSEESVENSSIVKEIVNTIVNQMKETNKLFSDIYRNIFYGGSYYDRLKYGRPDEYDIDIVMDSSKLDLNFSLLDLTNSNKPGFVEVKLASSDRSLLRLTEKGKSGNNYLATNKFMQWFHEVFSKSLNGCRIGRRKFLLDIENYGEIIIRVRRKGPSLVIKVDNGPHLAIDFVPTFLFREDQWPNGFRHSFKREELRPNFLIVPKSPNMERHTAQYNCRYWRLSFQKQEREIIKDRNNLKPALKLIKRLNRKYIFFPIIPSYYLKTIILWQIESEDDSFWSKPLSEVFMKILRKYWEHISDGEIKYFWHSKYNLIKDVDVSYIKRKLEKIINGIKNDLKHGDDGKIVAKYIHVFKIRCLWLKTEGMEQNHLPPQQIHRNYLRHYFRSTHYIFEDWD